MAGSAPRLGALLVCAGVASYAADAQACDCPRRKGFTEETWKAALFDRAENVVRGKFIAMNAGRDIVRDGSRYVVGQFVVEQTLKGNPRDRIEVLTGFGDGDCGLPHLLLYSINADRPVDIAISSFPGRSVIYAASSCGYWNIP